VNAAVTNAAGEGPLDALKRVVQECDEWRARARTAEHLLMSTGVYDRINEQERVRVDRWWNTYDAAISGILSGCEKGSEMDKKAHVWARSKANHAHGTLKPKVEKPA
jgi:hypothetical protein